MTRSASQDLLAGDVIDSDENYITTRHLIGYIPRAEATADDYANLGFMCGLEIHQQLLTDKKLFCRCPAGIYQKGDDFDAELIRHMRPTLSEMGEYDGTALMEKKTRKEIIYRIKTKPPVRTTSMIPRRSGSTSRRLISPPKSRCCSG